MELGKKVGFSSLFNVFTDIIPAPHQKKENTGETLNSNFIVSKYLCFEAILASLL